MVYDEAGVKTRFGFGPEMMVDYKALRGDTSDNIPGVPGIGEVTATELIKKFGSLKRIYKAIKDKRYEIGDIRESVVKKLLDGEKSAEMSYELSQIDENVPELGFKFEDCQIKDFDKEKVLKMFQEFEFVSLLKRVPGFEESKAQSLKPKVASSKKTIFNFTEIKSQAEVQNLVKKIHEEKRFACRALLSGKDVYTAQFFGLVVVLEGQGFYIKKSILKA